MASVIRLDALVRGMGREAQCTLETWKERSSTGRVFTRCRIVEDPPDLPDGSYEIFVAGQRFNTKKWSGVWELTFLPGWVRITDAA
ncbi:MAG TPA: hypothetical protein VJS11_09000 [Acidobacteriaceae bacterium]|nr:hypothetical protein [Acidobacteriaceae bacterium]